MLRSINEESYFGNNIDKAIKAIKSDEFGLACKYLHEEMMKNDHSAEVYNLLGIISEYKGDVILAAKYYRAAYVFDPTYKPVDRNLEKLTSFFYIFNKECLDFGDTLEKEYKKSYFIENNRVHIAHLKNNEAGKKSAC